MRWSLDKLYTGFESEQFKNDFNTIITEIDKIKILSAQFSELTKEEDKIKKIEEYIIFQNRLSSLIDKMGNYCNLTLSTDPENETAVKQLDKIEEVETELSEPVVLFEKFIVELADLDKLIDRSNVLKEHAYYLNTIKLLGKYNLSEKEEIVISKMTASGSSSWTKLQELLTSTLMVDIKIDGEDKRLPLPAIRNMAYEKEAAVRKNAYESELKAYEKIVKSSAAALNGIKGEVLTISKLRKYESPLHMTLIHSRMNKETLDAMFTAIKEFLPILRKYFAKKSELLGHTNGLPFYDLFAPLPMGEDMKFTYEEAKSFIVKNFSSFSKKLGDYAQFALDNNWVDAEQREGKRGGAFCSNIHSIKESRILLNFSGSFENVLTLAHELGHGYHGDCLTDETMLNSDYPMPIAETASTLCEIIATNAALKGATEKETVTILENDLSGATQVIVDIYSRFLFEDAIFTRRVDGSLSINELNALMLECQKEAYGDTFDENYMHKYMWVCKPHYYDANFNYYNFPYAFGFLLSKGLYAKYLESGDQFVALYDKMLSATGKNTLEDVAKIADIDLTSVDFWRTSLKFIAEDVERFVGI